jgi:prolyl-tRNA synthetase
MLQSKLFGKTLREAPKDESSFNAKLLAQAGYVDKLLAGVYSYLPLGLKVLNRIQEIIRQEMNAIDGQEIYMPALQSKELWQETGRWQTLNDVMFQFKGRGEKDYGLAPTHEEPVVDIARKRISSYRDLPLYLYQLQDKFRNEPRAKSGLLRGREFNMKDLYSFDADQNGLDSYYQKAIEAYKKIFNRCGLTALVVEASGGAFSKEYSHEFQVVTPYGEDEIVVCPNCDFAQNTEICKLNENDQCPKCKSKVQKRKSIEVGNIFKLGTKYSHDMNLTFIDENGRRKEVIMGCYGIGPSRVMGAVVEVSHDDKGIIWPFNLSPFQAHLLLLTENTVKKNRAKKLYDDLTDQGWEILFDDRSVSSGIKLNDADLIGNSVQLIIGEKTKDRVEFKFRDKSQAGNLKDTEIAGLLEKNYNHK